MATIAPPNPVRDMDAMYERVRRLMEKENITQDDMSTIEEAVNIAAGGKDGFHSKLLSSAYFSYLSNTPRDQRRAALNDLKVNAAGITAQTLTAYVTQAIDQSNEHAEKIKKQKEKDNKNEAERVAYTKTRDFLLKVARSKNRSSSEFIAFILGVIQGGGAALSAAYEDYIRREKAASGAATASSSDVIKASYSSSGPSSGNMTGNGTSATSSGSVTWSEPVSKSGWNKFESEWKPDYKYTWYPEPSKVNEPPVKTGSDAPTITPQSAPELRVPFKTEEDKPQSLAPYVAPPITTGPISPLQMPEQPIKDIMSGKKPAAAPVVPIDPATAKILDALPKSPVPASEGERSLADALAFQNQAIATGSSRFLTRRGLAAAGVDPAALSAAKQMMNAPPPVPATPTMWDKVGGAFSGAWSNLSEWWHAKKPAEATAPVAAAVNPTPPVSHGNALDESEMLASLPPAPVAPEQPSKPPESLAQRILPSAVYNALPTLPNWLGGKTEQAAKQGAEKIASRPIQNLAAAAAPNAVAETKPTEIKTLPPSQTMVAAASPPELKTASPPQVLAAVTPLTLKETAAPPVVAAREVAAETTAAAAQPNAAKGGILEKLPQVVDNDSTAPDCSDAVLAAHDKLAIARRKIGDLKEYKQRAAETLQGKLAAIRQSIDNSGEAKSGATTTAGAVIEHAKSVAVPPAANNSTTGTAQPTAEKAAAVAPVQPASEKAASAGDKPKDSAPPASAEKPKDAAPPTAAEKPKDLPASKPEAKPEAVCKPKALNAGM